VSLRLMLGSTADPVPCLTQDADLWFSDFPVEVEQAKRLCRGCPVRHECFADAVGRREAAGVWGGELFLEGVVVPFKRRRGRPAKSGGLSAAAYAAGSVGPGGPRSASMAASS